MPKKFKSTRKVVSYIAEEITEEKAKSLIVGVNRYGNEFDAMTPAETKGYWRRLFTLPVPFGMNCDDALLEYARNNIPPDTTFFEV